VGSSVAVGEPTVGTKKEVGVLVTMVGTGVGRAGAERM